ncbi:hypothetical protein [Pararcticibacter amylolyticus]|uniref:hypothetical protein n=1 Tax=Pararcticibacter amylolyticus TaxID=2173175 RepID=UPI0013048F70|nr:hypothetical protein [Pararcticibacter amylolyticus]
MRDMDFPGFIVVAVTGFIVLVLNRVYRFDVLTSVAIGGAVGFCGGLVLKAWRKRT